MHREGLFRVPGDQTTLRLAARRFRDKECSRIYLLDENDEEQMHPSPSSRDNVGGYDYFEGNEGDDGSVGGLDQCATLVVDDVDEVAQVCCCDGCIVLYLLCRRVLIFVVIAYVI